MDWFSGFLELGSFMETSKEPNDVSLTCASYGLALIFDEPSVVNDDVLEVTHTS